MPPAEPQISVKVFISYSHADHELRNKLEEHLSPLKYTGKITIWQDQEIPPGTNWEDQINTHLNEADLILLLISASFIASKYCWNKEVQTALQRHKAGKVRVIPIILRRVSWQDTPLGQLQALPTEAKPITQWNDLDDALDDVVQGIRMVVENLLITLREDALKKVKIKELTREIEFNLRPRLTTLNNNLVIIENTIREKEDRKRQLEAEQQMINRSIADLRVKQYVTKREGSQLEEQWSATNDKLLALGFYPEPTSFPPLRLKVQYEKMLSGLNRAVVPDGKDAARIVKREEIYRSIGRYEEALVDLNRAIVLNGKDAARIAKRGDTYRLMGKYEEALVDLNRAISLDGNDAWAIVTRGETYRLIGRYEEALVDLNRAIALDGNNAGVIATRGETYSLMGKYEEALVDLNRAIALDGRYTWAIMTRGETYRLMGKYEEALVDLNGAIALDEKYAWAIATRGEVYSLMGKYEEALVDLSRAIALDEKYAGMVAARGETYRLMGKMARLFATLVTLFR